MSACGAEFEQKAGIRPERMNSPLENREVRLRGLIRRIDVNYTGAGLAYSHGIRPRRTRRRRPTSRFRCRDFNRRGWRLPAVRLVAGPRATCTGG
jgi:hypothetical protein